MVNGEHQLQALVDKKKVIITEMSIRRDLHLKDAKEPIAAEAPNDDVTQTSNDLLLSGEDRLKLTELMNLCTKLSERVLDLEHTKDTRAQEITNLKLRFKKLEKKAGSSTHKLKRLYKGRSIEDIDKDLEVTLVDETQERNDDLMFNIGDLDDEEVVVAKQSEKVIEEVVNAAQTISTASVTVTAASNVILKSKDKGKAIMTKPGVPLKKKEQVRLDEELARNLEAEERDVVRLEREEAKRQEQASIALIESWDNTQAMMEADRLLAERLQTREQEELTDKQKTKRFVELLEKRKKHFYSIKSSSTEK
ncbi:copia protein [Tanacetum coccineum]